jgi:hypothetical protein
MSPGFSRQSVVFERGSKYLEIQGETVSDRLKPGLHAPHLLSSGAITHSRKNDLG